MPSVLNTNVASLFAAKNLESAQSRMANSVERLSSGLRINRAKDDAAGLGISANLTSQINGANQGVRNVNDGISIVQTAEGALDAASELGQRILTLATQAANGTLSSNDRKSIQAEMVSLVAGIGSISTRTKFGDTTLLSANLTDTASTAKYQVQVSNTASDVISLTNDAFRHLGTGSAAGTERATVKLTGLIAGQEFTIGGRTATATGTVTAAALRTALLSAQADDVNTVTDNLTTTNLVAHAATGWSFVAGGASDEITATFTASTAVTDLAISATTGNPLVTITTTVQGSAAGTGQTSTLSAAITTFGTDLGNSAVEATLLTDITAIQTAASNFIIALNTQRSKLGALQNQMEATVNNVQELSSNLASARSRILDTDYASETSNLTKGQILQQAATAMLAQANQMPNVILSLLK
jgi:flagellin